MYDSPPGHNPATSPALSAHWADWTSPRLTIAMSEKPAAPISMPTMPTSPSHWPRSRVGLSIKASSLQALYVSIPVFHIRSSNVSPQAKRPSGQS